MSPQNKQAKAGGNVCEEEGFLFRVAAPEKVDLRAMFRGVSRAQCSREKEQMQGRKHAQLSSLIRTVVQLIIMSHQKVHTIGCGGDIWKRRIMSLEPAWSIGLFSKTLSWGLKEKEIETWGCMD